MIDLDFIKAGNSTFTFANKNGDRYTYKVKFSDKIKRHFVYMLTGSNNENDYTYIGILNQNRVQVTQKSKLGVNSIPFRVFNYAMRIVCGKSEKPNGYFLEHNGHCGRCGRKLTTPESIKAGLGPICINK